MYMKKILWRLLLTVSCTGFVRAQESEGIQFFHGTWEEALQQAKKEGKMIFIDCYADWCGPCFNMMKTIFPLKEVGDYFNRHFINLKCNMERGEEGIALKKRFDVAAYPTFLFVTSEGYVAHRSSGAMKSDAFIALAEKAVAIGHNGYEERFAKGERDEAFLKEYVHEMLSLHSADGVENLLNTLYKEQGSKVLRDKDYWDAFVCCAADINAPLSLAFVKEYKKLYKVHGEYAVLQKIRNLYASIRCALQLYDTQGRKEVVNEERKQAYFDLIKERKLPDYKMLQQEVDYIILLRAGKYEEAYALGEQSLAKADARGLCNWATLGERMVRQNKEVRLKMAAWVKRALELQPNAEIEEEGKSVLHDLETLDRPFNGGKGSKGRSTIPMRGYRR